MVYVDDSYTQGVIKNGLVLNTTSYSITKMKFYYSDQKQGAEFTHIRALAILLTL